MQDFSLAAAIRAGVFEGIDLPDEIKLDLDRAVKEWRDYSNSLNIQLERINGHLQSVVLRKFGGRRPSLEEFETLKYVKDRPSREDIDALDALFAEFWKIFEHKGEMLNSWDNRITTAANRAALYVGQRQKRLRLYSGFISAAYIGLFLIGSIVSIIAAIVSGVS
jgi:hypothetical protein